MEHNTALQLHDDIRQALSIRSEFILWIERPRAGYCDIQPSKLSAGLRVSTARVPGVKQGRY